MRETSRSACSRWLLAAAAALACICWPLSRRPAFCAQHRLRGVTPRGQDAFGIAEVQKTVVDFQDASSRSASSASSGASFLMFFPVAAAAALQLSSRSSQLAGQGLYGRSSAARARHVLMAAKDADRYSSVFLLKEEYAKELTDLKSACSGMLDDKIHDDVWLLRFLLESKGDVAKAQESVKTVLQWRSGEGKAIVEAAAAAVQKAQADGGWNNDPVFAAAPNSEKIGKFITPKCLIVISTSKGDLMSMIRASVVPSKELMEAVTVDELVDFFIYAREVNSLVAAARTKETSRLCRLLAANDLTGVSSFPDSKFQEALSQASAKAVELYPGLAGPTVLLNLPFLARALVSLLLPLFPGAVKEKVKFATFGMDYMKELPDVTKEPMKGQFLADIEKVLKS